MEFGETVLAHLPEVGKGSVNPAPKLADRWTSGVWLGNNDLTPPLHPPLNHTPSLLPPPPPLTLLFSPVSPGGSVASPGSPAPHLTFRLRPATSQANAVFGQTAQGSNGDLFFFFRESIDALRTLC